MTSTLRIAVDEQLSLGHRVCSYGYFVLAPNRWVALPATKAHPAKGELVRPLNLKDGAVLRCVIKQSRPGADLVIETDRKATRGQQSEIKLKLRRMLRLDEDFSAWNKMHKKARREQFDCIFRSPTLFEDMVKTITSCNVTWPNTRRMNWLMCQRYGTKGAFPTPEQLAVLDEAELKESCRVGYRAERIILLAKAFADGTYDPEWFESEDRETGELYDAVKAIYGFGDYAASNMLQLLGRYERLAVDSELIRHFKEVHKAEGNQKDIVKAAEAYYDQFAPYQFLAYWFELWCGIVKKEPAHRWEERGKGFEL